MGNIIDYAQNQLSGFDKLPFNRTDSLVLAQLAYLKFSSLPAGAEPTLHDLLKSELLPGLLHNVRDPESNRALLLAAGMNPRLRDFRALRHVDRLDGEAAEQFSALTFLLPDGSIYIAFRGTDATLVGWKEDFNMAFLSPVPSQLSALAYLESVAADYPGTLRIGGHSKGGNLAVYAACYCPPAVKERIVAVYSHDGPGFKEDIFASPEFEQIRPRIDKTLPKQSLIGMLLQTREPCTVVESDRFWLMQHDPFSWEVGQTDFVRAPKLSGGAEHIDNSLNRWLAGLDDKKRREFVDALFTALAAGGATNYAELSADWYGQLTRMLSAYKGLDPQTRKFVTSAVGRLLGEVITPQKAAQAGRPMKTKTETEA